MHIVAETNRVNQTANIPLLTKIERLSRTTLSLSRPFSLYLCQPVDRIVERQECHLLGLLKAVLPARHDGEYPVLGLVRLLRLLTPKGIRWVEETKADREDPGSFSAGGTNLIDKIGFARTSGRE